MGTKVHCRSYLPGFYSMRDLNEDSCSSSWPLFYGDKTVINGQYCNGYMPRSSISSYPGQDKEALKQKMLEHEAVFKNQVYELHRLYRVQRDMMEEIKRKELHKDRASIEPASSSSLQGCQVPSEENRKWHMAGFSLLNTGYGRTPTSETELVKSLVSCTKGNTTQQGQFPLRNRQTSNDAETMDSRPSKVRKKLLDLHLPAEEYMDTEEVEKLPENKGSNISGYACNGKNASNGPERGMKVLLDNQAGVRTDFRIDGSASASCLRGSVGLADLNDPVQFDEPVAPSSVDFPGRASQNEETRGMSQPTKHNTGYLSHENKVNEGGRFLHTYEARSTRSNLSSVGQGRPPAVTMSLPLHPMQGILNPFHHPSGVCSTGYSREDQWKEGPHRGVELSDRSRDRQSNSHLGGISSQAPGLYPLGSSSYVANLWDQSVLSWPKPASSFAQNAIPLEASLNSAPATSRSFQPCAQSQEPFSSKWQVNDSSRLNPVFKLQQNGLYEASASVSKRLQVDLPSTSMGYLNRSKADDLASDHSTSHVSGNFPNGSSRANSKPVIDINLNEVVSKSSSDEAVILQDLNKTDRKSKPGEHQHTLPWLKPKPPHVSEGANCHKNVHVRDLNQHLSPKHMLASIDCEIAPKKAMTETQTVKKLLGFPIFERGVPANELASLASTSESIDHHPEGKNSCNERKNRMIDINVACEPEQVAIEEPNVDKEEREKGTRIRDYIDLNSCASDCEDPPVPSCDRRSAGSKTILKIDLEAPASMDSDDDNNTLTERDIPSEISLPSLENKNEQVHDEVLKDAADMLVAISLLHPQLEGACLPSGLSLENSLLWFVDAVASCADELDDMSGKESRFKDGLPQQDSPEEVDEFEAMILQLPETKEEEYMPTPFISQVQIVDDTGFNTLPTRPRRGQSRRGRQRRDFQRDILPGLASLSRHEVTEDLQTFAGIMKATGFSWSSGLTRRNGTRGGGTRGRRRAVAEAAPTAIPAPASTQLMQQFANIEAGLEDRSLMGWWKTTRRPRRQRCPAGNQPIVLT